MTYSPIPIVPGQNPVTGGGGEPTGPTGAIQWNNDGEFNGSNYFVTDGGSVRVGPVASDEIEATLSITADPYILDTPYAAVGAPPSVSTTEVGRKDGGSNSIDAGICGVAVFPSALTTGQHLALAQAAGLA